MSQGHHIDVGRLAQARLSRRGFLGGAAALGVLAATRGHANAATWPTRMVSAGASSPTLAADPFTLGVASGDPLPDAVVLWTRLAPNPLEVGGGMPSGDVDVEWEMLDDDGRKVVASGTAMAVSEFGHSVHVDVRDLEPDRPYRYRFMTGDYETPLARTRTAPARRRGRRLRFGQVSCQRFDSGYYAAYGDIAADEDLDAVVHCGDYIYESPGDAVRVDDAPYALTIDDYRARYALYRSDTDLQAAHASVPWLITWDDHEVENNYSGTAPEASSTTPDRADFAARKAAAYQAWWEHMPVRFDPPDRAELRIHRRVRWGRVADFLVLDTRQYRSPQACAVDGGDIGPRCDAALEDDYTMLGAAQERWLNRRLRGADAAWTALVQGVAVMQWRFAPGNEIWNLDGWDGYPVARDRLMAALRESRAPNPVVLTGDVHSSWVAALVEDFDDPSSPVLGTEHICPGVSSEASSLLAGIIEPVLANGPHVRWGEAEHRGWVRHDVTRDEWRTEYRFVDDTTVPGSPVTTATEWVTPARGAVTEA